MDDEEFDVIVVGGGVAGSVAAHQLASGGHSVLLIERGNEPGAKNLSGGIFYCHVMEQVFPDFVEQAPVERRITRNCISLCNESSYVNIDAWDARLAEPVNAVSVLRARLDPWLAEQCESAGAMVMPGVRVDSLVMEGDRVVGVRAGEDELRAKIVIAADGVNSFLAQDAQIRAKEPPQHLAVGVKSVIGLSRDLLEARFRLGPDDGAAYAIVGDATQGVAGGGFLYTNRDSVSVGVVLRLDDLAASGLASSDIHDRFLEHPAISGLIAGGEPLEYGCHLTIEDGPAMTSHDLSRPGLLIAGDAGGFTLNTGFTIRGMDLAAGSAIAAATTAAEALAAGDFSAQAMARYRHHLDSSFVGADLKTYAKAPAFLEHRELFRDVGLLASDVMYRIFDLDGTPRQHLIASARQAVADSPMSLWSLAKLGFAGARGL